MNGKIVIDIIMLTDGTRDSVYTDDFLFSGNNIKSIVTKEQFKSMEYRLEEQ